MANEYFPSHDEFMREVEKWKDQTRVVPWDELDKTKLYKILHLSENWCKQISYEVGGQFPQRFNL